MKKTDIKIGDTFGDLTVVSNPFSKYDEHQHYYVECKCSCGNIDYIRLDHLNKYTKCKECRTKETGLKRVLKRIYPGKVFGLFTVIDEPFKKYNNHYYVKCIDNYNREYTIRTEYLLSGKKLPKTPEQLVKEKASKKEVRKNLALEQAPIGSKWGKLTVIGAPIFRESDKNHRYIYIPCICDCGKKVEVNFNDLISGKTTKCLNCMYIDNAALQAPIRSTFNDWTVISEPFLKRSGKQNHTFVRCRCKCGTEEDVRVSKLIRGESTKCTNCAWDIRVPAVVGARFGKLTILEEVEARVSVNGNRRRRVLCQCDCGKTVVKDFSKLLHNYTPYDCGCSNLYANINPGSKYRNWTVLERTTGEKGWKNHTMYLCKCDCGNIKKISASNLINGTSYECNKCKGFASAAELGTDSKTLCALNRVYCGIIARCYNPKNKSYPRYGGRGIKVCDEWLNDHKEFYKWAIKAGYKVEMMPYGRNKWSIDRLDPNGNYCPENCRWVTLDVQAKNRRNSKQNHS